VRLGAYQVDKLFQANESCPELSLLMALDLFPLTLPLSGRQGDCCSVGQMMEACPLEGLVGTPLCILRY